MPLAVWPPSLPAALMLGASEKLPQNTIASATDAAIDKIRRRFTGGVRRYEGDTILKNQAETDDEDENLQIDTFLEFFTETLKDGSQPFTWTHPRTNAAITCRFRPEAPPELQYITATVAKVRIVLEYCLNETAIFCRPKGNFCTTDRRSISDLSNDRSYIVHRAHKSGS